MPPSKNCSGSVKRTSGKSSHFSIKRKTLLIGVCVCVFNPYSRLVQQHQQAQQQLQQQQQPNARPNQTTPNEAARLQAEIQALKQRLQETGARSENELEQWRKVVEQEKGRADQNEKAAQEMHKRIQVSEAPIEIYMWKRSFSPTARLIADNGQATAAASATDSAAAKAGRRRTSTTASAAAAAATVAKCTATDARIGKIAQRTASVECRTRTIPSAARDARAGAGKEPGKNLIL